jgi:hypothetical protein
MRASCHILCYLWLAAALSVVTLATFWPVTRNGFINLDDPPYVTKNLMVSDGLTLAGVRWAFTTGSMGNWHPVTWMSHMLDCQLFGLESFGHHLTSALIHSLSAALLFVILRRMTGSTWLSAAVAGLFALHPLRVESVAWVAERKDVLATFFWLATCWAYLRYVERGRTTAYALMLVLFGLGLMSKPMLVTLPAALLLLDYWPLRRFGPVPDGRPVSRGLGQLLLEKAPLFLLSLVVSVVTVITQSGEGAVGTLADYPLHIRVANAVVSYVAYVRMTVWPVGLAVFYPHPGAGLCLWTTLAALLLLVCVCFWCWRWRFSHPFMLVGWLWYLETLFPVIGVIHIGLQAYADRYTYVPHIGLLIMAVWGAEAAVRAWGRGATGLGVACLCALVALACVTRSQIGHWRSSITLFARALEVTRNNALMHNNLAVEFLELGMNQEAAGHAREALRIQPDYTNARCNLGEACRRLGRLEEAIEHYTASLSENPADAKLRYCFGLALEQLGRRQEAIERYREALRLDPEYAAAAAHLRKLLDEPPN